MNGCVVCEASGIVYGRDWKLEICIQREDVLCFVWHYTSLLVFSYSLLKKVSLPFKGDVLHEIKWILNIEHLQEVIYIFHHKFARR